jgi:hypothetical protein
MMVDALTSLRDTVLGVQAITGARSPVEGMGVREGKGRGMGLLIG